MKSQESVDRELLAKELRFLAERVEEGDPEACKKASKLLGRSRVRKNSPPSPQIDAFKILREEGEEGLRHVLEHLELAELRSILLAYGLDKQRLARKWKNKDRLREYILGRLVTHFTSGDVFLKS